MNLCSECKVNYADCVCLCRYPPSQYLCNNDLQNHMLKLNSPFPHRFMPISMLEFLKTQENFDACLRQHSNFERMKHELSEVVARADARSDQLNETCDLAINTIQAFRPFYQQVIYNSGQSLKDQVNWVVEEISRMLQAPGSLPQNDLAASCWNYVSGQTDRLIPRFVLNEDPDALLREYRLSVDSLVQGLSDQTIGRERRETEEMGRKLVAADSAVRDLNAQIAEMGQLQGVIVQKEKTVEELRTTLAAYDVRLQHLNNTLQEVRKAQENELDQVELEHQSELASIQAGLIGEREELDRQWRELLGHDQAWWPDLVSRINADTILCCVPYCLLWPMVGFAQRNTDVEMDDVMTFLLPTLLCCVGAAINRTRLRQRRRVQGSFLIDLSLYFLGVWNACLLEQERDTRGMAHAHFYR